MTSTQVVETSGAYNSSFQNNTHLHDDTIQTTDTSGFKTIYYYNISKQGKWKQNGMILE